MGMAPCANGLGNRTVSKPNIFMRIGLLPDQKRRNRLKTLDAVNIAAQEPIDTGFRRQNQQK
jgi:hypothetical protein